MEQHHETHFTVPKMAGVIPLQVSPIPGRYRWANMLSSHATTLASTEATTLAAGPNILTPPATPSGPYYDATAGYVYCRITPSPFIFHGAREHSAAQLLKDRTGSTPSFAITNPGPAYPALNPLGSNPVSSTDIAGSRKELKDAMIRKRKASDDINPPADNSSTSPAAPKSSVRSRALYGKLHIDKEGRGKYQDTRRFQDWLSAARSNTEPDDFFHRWLHQDEEQRQYNLDETVDGAVNPVDIDSQAMACHNQVEHNHTDTSVFDRGKTRVQELGTEFKRLLMKPIKKKRSADVSLSDQDLPAPKRSRLATSFGHRVSGIRKSFQQAVSSRRGSVVSSEGTSITVLHTPSHTSGVKPLDRVRVCILGDNNAGKTALLNRFETGLFSEHTESTPTCSCKEYLVQVDGTTVLLELWDMPGEVDNEVSSTLMGHFFHGVMLCFSLESDDNLDAVVNRWPTELQIHLIHAPVFLVGLKRDLRPAYPTLRLRFLNEPSPVSQDLGKQAAVEMHACGYFECSSKAEDDDSVEETFEAVIRSIIQNQDTEDRKRKERIRHERALEFTRQTRRQVSALLCGVLL